MVIASQAAEYLGDEDLHDHGYRVDHGVPQGHTWVGAGTLIGEGEDGGLGLRPAQEAGQTRAAHLHNPSHRDVQAQTHDRGDDEAGEEDLLPVTASEGIGDLAAGLRAGLGQEDEQPELAEHRCGGEGHSGHEVPDAADLAEDQPDDERARCRSNGERRPGRGQELPLADDDAHGHAQAQRDRVDRRQATGGVAEEVRDLRHASCGCDHADPVALLEHQVGGAHHIGVTAANTGDGGSELVVDVQLGDRVAGELGV